MPLYLLFEMFHMTCDNSFDTRDICDETDDFVCECEGCSTDKVDLEIKYPFSSKDLPFFSEEVSLFNSDSPLTLADSEDPNYYWIIPDIWIAKRKDRYILVEKEKLFTSGLRIREFVDEGYGEPLDTDKIKTIMETSREKGYSIVTESRIRKDTHIPTLLKIYTPHAELEHISS